MGNDTLSIIIPNYNNELYLEECFNSILTQTLLPDEVIIIDDCSTDASRDIIDRFTQTHAMFHSIFLTKNGGVSAARNEGIRVATSEYVSFLDADDFYYNPKKLENEMALIKKYRNKGKDILAYSSPTLVDEDSNLLLLRPLSPIFYRRGKVLPMLLSDFNRGGGIREYCIRRSVLLAVGGFTFYKDFYEDLDLTIKLAKLVEFYPTLQHGSAYRKKATGLSHRPAQEAIDTEREIFSTYYPQCTPIEKLQTQLYRALKKAIGFIRILVRRIKRN